MKLETLKIVGTMRNLTQTMTRGTHNCNWKYFRSSSIQDSRVFTSTFLKYFNFGLHNLRLNDVVEKHTLFRVCMSTLCWAVLRVPWQICTQVNIGRINSFHNQYGTNWGRPTMVLAIWYRESEGWSTRNLNGIWEHGYDFAITILWGLR